MNPFFSRLRPTLEELDFRRNTRAEGIRGVLKIFGVIFILLVAFLVSMLLLTPLVDLYLLEQEKERVERQLKTAKAEEAEANSRLRWMMDPEYFEQMARDRANMAKDGEIVVRRPTAEQQQQMLREEQNKQKKEKKKRRH